MQPAGGKAGVHNGYHTHLNGLGLGLSKSQAHRDEVAGTLTVDGEQGNLLLISRS